MPYKLLIDATYNLNSVAFISGHQSSSLPDKSFPYFLYLTFYTKSECAVVIACPITNHLELN